MISPGTVPPSVSIVYPFYFFGGILRRSTEVEATVIGFVHVLATLLDTTPTAPDSNLALFLAHLPVFEPLTRRPWPGDRTPVVLANLVPWLHPMLLPPRVFASRLIGAHFGHLQTMLASLTAARLCFQYSICFSAEAAVTRKDGRACGPSR
jgi:hypothetical protein